MIFDTRPCELGEGAFWHPARAQFFWFDILGKTLHSRTAQGPHSWTFDHMVSATGWITRDRLLIAGERGLMTFDLTTGQSTPLAPVEADNPDTRSNDGRADRQGGFWIGTMSKRGGADTGKGAIYRHYRGETRRLFAGITIPNSICFSLDGQTAYFSDTVTHRINRVALDASGWPRGAPETFLDLSAEGLYPDGATVDAAGNIWNAQWGAARVACYAPDGTFLRAAAIDAPHTSCPAFGGPALTDLFVTTAREHMDAAALAAAPLSGQTFKLDGVAQGLPEPQVIL